MLVELFWKQLKDMGRGEKSGVGTVPPGATPGQASGLAADRGEAC